MLADAPPRRNRLSDPTTESVIVERRLSSRQPVRPLAVGLWPSLRPRFHRAAGTAQTRRGYRQLAAKGFAGIRKYSVNIKFRNLSGTFV
jgi:hypothetical protein